MRKSDSGQKTTRTEAQLPDPSLVEFLDNDYVKQICGSKIFYTPDFYIDMYKLITLEKKSYVEAYSALGFDVSKLGKSRAEQAGKNAMKKAEKNKLFTIDPSMYDGTVPLREMPDLKPEEMLAYLKARTMYLEAVVETQKKIRSALEDGSIPLR